MSRREDAHRLVDEVAADRLDDVLALLRQLVDSSQPERPARVFGSLGVGHGPSDLGARAKDIVRRDLGEGRKSA